MNTVLTSLFASAVFATITNIGCTAQDLPAVTSSASIADQWQSHLLSQMPSGLTAIAVSWDSSGAPARVRFTVTTQADTPRYRPMPFFADDCSGSLRDLKAALSEAGKPVEYLKLVAPAGTEMELHGSFVRRLDGKLSKVVWNQKETSTVGDESPLPKEDSAYAIALRQKMSELRQGQANAKIDDFVTSVAVVSGEIATLTHSKEAARVAEVSRQLSAFTNSSGGDTNAPVRQTNLQSGLNNVTSTAKGLIGLFSK